MDRRTFVNGLGGVPQAGLAAPCTADAASSVMVEFAEYLRLTRQVDACADDLAMSKEKVLGVLFAQRDPIEDRLIALPSLTAADFAAKVIVDTARGNMFSDWKTGALWIEARALTGWGEL